MTCCKSLLKGRGGEQPTHEQRRYGCGLVVSPDYSCRGQTSGASMPALPLGHTRPPTCHTCPPPVIPASHLSFPQGFSGNPESFMLENLNGGSMPAIGGRGAGIQKKRPALPGHPKAGEWAGIPAGGSGAVRFRGLFLEKFCGFPLKPAGMTEEASPAGMTEGASLAGMTEEASPAGMTEGVSVTK